MRIQDDSWFRWMDSIQSLRTVVLHGRVFHVRKFINNQTNRSETTCQRSRTLTEALRWELSLRLPCALRSSAGSALPRRSFSAPRSWRTGPSSWCIRHCGGPQSGCTPHLSATRVLLGMRGSHTSPPRCCTGRNGIFIKTSQPNLQVTTYFCGIYLANLCWLRPSTFPLISATILLLSSARPCSKTCWMT